MVQVPLNTLNQLSKSITYCIQKFAYLTPVDSHVLQYQLAMVPSALSLREIALNIRAQAGARREASKTLLMYESCAAAHMYLMRSYADSASTSTERGLFVYCNKIR